MLSSLLEGAIKAINLLEDEDFKCGIERDLLGAMLLKPKSIDQIFTISIRCGRSTSGYFCSECHDLIFKTILALNMDKKQVDLVSVTEELRQQGKLEDAGGVSYIASLTVSVPTGDNMSYYFRKVEDMAVLRGVVELFLVVLSRF